MAKGSRVVATSLIFILLASTCIVAPAHAQSDLSDDIDVLHTAINPSNNKTYHLLTASSWEDAAYIARTLDGYLTTIDDEEENTWVFDTFASFDEQSRHLWIGLNDVQDEGMYRWHDGTPFLYRNWGVDQPTGGDDSDYVHIASTNMGNIMPQTWNDLENNPEYFPVYGVVEVGPGADFSLRFDGLEDHIVIEHDEGLVANGSLSIEATIKASNLDGIRFVTMKGDYGWGMYLANGAIGYASEYSLSKHPTSNMSITEDTWHTIGVHVNEGIGGMFTIDGIPAGNISAEDANIPEGDFGSNDCYTSGDSCDELYIARAGAGCDCYYFEGIIDDITIAHEEDGEWNIASQWTFWEGEGSDTGDALNDQTQNRVGFINGADWVMPDGSIVAQAVELSNDEYYLVNDIKEGDTLLFYADLDEYTFLLDVYMWGWSEDFFEEWEDDDYFDGLRFDAYVGYDRIPAPWDNDLELSGFYGSIWNSWTWPEADVVWFSVVANADIDELEIQATWDVAEEPPSLDEMTELFNGVPITSQSLNVDRGSYDAETSYYYVNVTDSLTELKIETYGGKGNVDLILSAGGPIDPNYYYSYDIEPYYEEFIEGNAGQSSVVWSANEGNNEEANLFDVEPGIYYITAFTYRKANDFTIVADYTYAPANSDPSTAIELQPGIAHGPMSGYDGLDQYFFVEVPTGTERLEVDLNGGFGEAALHMRYETIPTASEADHHSAVRGAGDKIGFNNPTPGTWYILLDSDSVFSGVSITASFEDLYVWEYDGTPIELFNNEEIDGLSAPAGKELYFYVDLQSRSEELIIMTSGGEGSLYIQASGEVDYGGFFDFGEFDEFEMFEDEMFEEEYTSYGDGTDQEVYVYSPAQGQFDITLVAVDDFSDVSIVAYWKEVNRPGPDPVLPVDVEPDDIFPCDYGLEAVFADADTNGDGLFNFDEFRRSGPPEGTEFTDVDENEDGMIEFTEVVAYLCTCENELTRLIDQTPFKTSIEFMDSIALKNEFEFKGMDSNRDQFITHDELEKAIETCKTTYDPFDRDGDGVPDIKDQFPDNPDEQSDADGDGIGDNADFAPSVANDVVYGAGGALLIVLIGMMILFLRGGGGPQQHMEQEWNKTDAFSEQMLNMNNEYSTREELPQAPTLAAVETASQSYQSNELPIYDFGQVDEPAASLMGVMDSSGREHIEYPANSGRLWSRDQPDSPWIKE